MGKKIDRTGERRYQAVCEMNAEIIRYGDAEDIDVKFENEQIREKVRYRVFAQGKLWPDNNVEEHKAKVIERKLEEQRKKWVGKQATMRCGLECTVIEYYDACNITVQFSDGVVVYKKRCDEFRKKAIGHPTVKAKTGSVDERKKAERIGTRLQMNSGLWATLDIYNQATDIIIKFDDGATVQTRWSEFSKGCVSHPSSARVCDKNVRVGEKHKMSNGMVAEIKKYESARNVTVEFEDGAVVAGLDYKAIQKGHVVHPTKRPIETMSLQEFAIRYYLRNFGFVKIGQGEWEARGFGRLELDFYNQDLNIAIEYDGDIHEMIKAVKRDIKKNHKCKDLKVQLYRIRAHMLPVLNEHGTICYILDKDKKITDRLTDCGEILKEILTKHGVRINDSDIDFIRDANAIIDEYKSLFADPYEQKHVGEKSYSNSAKMSMEIKAYYDSHHLDIEFEDGARRSNITYSSFIGGRVKHPSQLFDAVAEERMKEIRVRNNGLEAKIIRYGSSKDIDVQFLLDGKIREHMKYECFKSGKIRHPDVKLGNTSQYKNKNKGE